ncbi:hypothetical protein [Psychrobacter sp. BI730]|uniref:hypothetical protein n=1 Tax=Psychrobacter sp. BI730 TaxID=2705463 RepID=UPI0015C6D0EA|nr:hypothetical protein [Psychrobacter sp. BI730]NYR09615.1 hypothetical protein [Psychrobacter sp. BI730]
MAIEDDLPQLILCPLLENYNVDIGNDVLSTQYTNGPPRLRLNNVGAPHQISVTFRHKAQHHDYIWKFWELYKVKPFAMRLIIKGTTMKWFQCYFNGMPKDSVLGGNVFEFSTNLIVIPKPVDLELAATFVYFYEQTGGDISGFMNQLEKLVNEDLPDALGSLNA